VGFFHTMILMILLILLMPIKAVPGCVISNAVGLSTGAGYAAGTAEKHSSFNLPEVSA
jgi:hypothetical protein